MRISILGLGYVGAVSAACLAKRGHTIVGVDVAQSKVDMVNAGRSPIVEEGLGSLLKAGAENGRITATTNVRDAIFSTDISFICVGTPSERNGGLNLDYVRAVAAEIGEVLAEKQSFHTVVVRSTVLPGTVNNVVRPVLEASSGMTAGVDFGLAINPEFLRESTAIKDYDNPPMTVIGALDEASAKQLQELYADLDAPLLTRPIEIAEMVKYTCNVWHAAKVAFANEIGSIAKAVNVDGRDVMDIVCTDTSLNISSYYMKPGFAFGGSCLPKDVKALNYKAKELDVDVPLIASIMESNEKHVKKAFDLVSATSKRRVGMFGLSFKAGTDDLRESPLVELAEMLLGKGYDLKIYDENVKYASIHGANKDYINNKIPHVSSLLENKMSCVLDHSELIILGNSDPSFSTLLEELCPEKELIDLVGFMTNPSCEVKSGICW